MDYQSYQTVKRSAWQPSRKTFEQWKNDGMRRVSQGTKLLWLPPLKGDLIIDWQSRVDSSLPVALTMSVPLPAIGVYAVKDVRHEQGNTNLKYLIEYVPEGWTLPVRLWVYWHDANVVNYDLMDCEDMRYFVEEVCPDIPEFRAEMPQLWAVRDQYTQEMLIEHTLLMDVVDKLHDGFGGDCPMSRVEILGLCLEARSKWRAEVGLLRPLISEDKRVWKVVQSRVGRKIRAALPRENEV
jgi:hypothetical protein